MTQKKVGEKKVWRKILYERQDFPDNYSHQLQFLEGLKKNVTAETYSLGESVRGSCVLTEAMSCVVLYVLVFSLTTQEIVSHSLLLGVASLVAFLGFLFIFLLDRCSSEQSTLQVGRELKTLAIFVGFGYGMSPIFKTLTETISTDTIYATATFMFLLSLIFHDYGVDVFIVSASLSLNAAIFGAVCLISRLPTSNDAFTLLVVAVELFAFYPIVQSKLQILYPVWSDVVLTVLLSVMCTAGLLYFQPITALLYVIIHLLINFVCPYWLIRIQPMKSTIHGPWDEAVIQHEKDN